MRVSREPVLQTCAYLECDTVGVTRNLVQTVHKLADYIIHHSLLSCSCPVKGLSRAMIEAQGYALLHVPFKPPAWLDL